MRDFRVRVASPFALASPTGEGEAVLVPSADLLFFNDRKQNIQVS
jgi:hypothetical protein